MGLSARLTGLLRRRLVEPVRALLVQGLTPEKVALTLALGLCIAVFPVVGATTVLSVLAAIVFRLNMPLIQTVNVFSAPLQIAFIVPFIRMGEALSGRPPLRMPLGRIVSAVTAQPLAALSTLWETTVWAVVAWCLAAPPAGLAIFLVLRPVLRHAASRIAARRAGP